MDHDETQLVPSLEREEAEQAWKVGLTELHLSPREIRALTALRRRWNQAPDSRDIPAEERRLLFARWMVEHGRLSDDDGSGQRDNAYLLAIPACSGTREMAQESTDGTCPAPAHDGGHEDATEQSVDADRRLCQHTVGARTRNALRSIGAALGRIARWLFEPDDDWGLGYQPWSNSQQMSPWSSWENPPYWRQLHSRW